MATLPSNDSHSSGCWLVLLDKYGSEYWYQLWQGADGCYTTAVSLYTGVYGTGRVKFYIVDNGLAYGAPQANQAVVMGHSDSNPLFRSKNFYIVPAGYSYSLGMAFDGHGQRCVYATQGSPCN